MAAEPLRHGAGRATARLGRLGLALAVIAAAGGCAADDPREGGFMGGVVGLFSGQYTRNVEARRARLDGLRAEESRLGDESTRLEEERAGQLAEAERRRAGEAALARHAAELEEQLQSLRHAAHDAERELAGVRSAIDRLDDGAPSGPPPPPVEAEEPGPAPPAVAAAPREAAAVAGLLEEATALEARLAELLEAATRAQDERLRLRTEIDRLSEDLTGARGPSPRPEGADGAPEG